MDLLQLKYFQTVAKMENMTQAAASLYISQSTLSRTISRLENSLGVKLFDRTGRQIRLNAIGKDFLKHVDRIFFELEEAKREIDARLGKDSDTVFLITTIPVVLSGPIDQYTAEHPKVLFSHQIAKQDLLPSIMETSRVDCVISERMINAPNLLTRSLFEDELFLLASALHPFSARQTVPLREIRNEKIITPLPGNCVRDFAEVFCKNIGIRPNILFEDDSSTITSNMVRMVTQNLGLGFVSKYSLYKDIISNEYYGSTIRASLKNVRLIRIAEPVCRWEVFIMTPKKKHQSKAAGEFIDYILDYFKKMHQEMDDTIFRYFNG